MFPLYVDLTKLDRLPVKIKSLVLADKKHIFISERPSTHKVHTKKGNYITGVKLTEEHKSYIQIRTDSHTKTFSVSDTENIIAIDFNPSEGILIFVTTCEVKLFNGELHQIAIFEPRECHIITALMNHDKDLIALYCDNGALLIVKINVGPDLTCFTTFYEVADRTLRGKVNISWGSSFTQSENANTQCQTEYLDNTPVWFNWSLNNLLVVNSLLAPDTYTLRIFSARCILQYRSNPRTYKGLDSPVAFNPSGSLIAVSVWLENDKQRISLLKANADFELVDRMAPDTGLRIKILKWSSCGAYLVAYKEPVYAENVKCIDIYTCNNDIWTMGTRILMGLMELQYLTVTESNTNLISIELHFEKDIFKYNYVHKIVRSDNVVDNMGTVAVITHNTVNVHISEKEIQSPDFEDTPYSLAFQDIVFTVVFDELMYRMAVVEISNKVTIYNYNDGEVTLEETITLPDLRCEEPICYVSFYFNQDMFVSVGSRGMHFGYKLLTDEEIRMILNSDPTTMYTRYVDFEEIFQIPAQPVPLLQLCALNSRSRISLDTNCSLSLDDLVIEGQFTSFIKHNNFFLTTFHKDSENTVDDQLLLLDRTSINQIRSGKAIFDVSYVRNVPVGSTVVTVIFQTPKVIILLPGGHLELIEVRGITIFKLNRLVISGSYTEAYNLIRLQSLGLDLLVDLDPQLFMRNVEEICTKVVPKRVLIHFIMELSDDHTLTSEDMKIMHTKRYIFNKRTTISGCITEALLKLKNISEYLPALICTALCNTNVGYDIPAALEMFECLCQKNYDKYRKQIKFTLDLLYNYLDYQELYRQALLAYNVYIAELVAKRSNMDPRTYKEKFKSFKVEDLDLMRFRVNDFLQEYHRAVPYMSILFDKNVMDKKEVLSYAKRNNCLKSLYEVVSIKSPLFVDISKLYAESLAKHGKTADAGLVLERANIHLSAFGFYMKAKMWREALVSLDKANLKPIPLRDYHMSLAVNLKSWGMHSEAAIVFMEYLHQVDFAIECLYDVKNFTEALRYIHQENAESLIKSSLIPRLSTHMHEQFDVYQSKENKLKSSYNQLKDYVVRVENNAHRNAEAFKGEQFDSNSEVLSVHTFKLTLTDTPSVRSMRRRERQLEKKHNDSQEGSEYENIALIVKMHDIINEINVIANEIIDCSLLYCSIAYEIEMTDFIRFTYKHLKDGEKYIAELCADVWTAALKNGTYGNDPRYYNINVINVKYRVRPEGCRYKRIPLINYK